MSYNGKRSRVRYDRIVVVATIFIVLLILLVSCCKSCGSDSKKSSDESSIVPTSSKDDKEGSDKNSDDSNTTDDGNSSNDTDTTYTSISAMPNEIYTGDLILVNKSHEYSFPATEEAAGITPVYEMASDSYKYKDYEISLASKTISAINTMMDAFYNKTGITDVMVVSGYLTKESQDELTDTDVKGGFSEYHTGLSFGLSVYPDDDEESPYYYTPEGDYAWINDNAANYGFILRYPEDKTDKTGIESKSHQFRYVGIPHAIYMKENNLCLEEYIEAVKSYTSTGEHIKVTAGEKKYEIYYAPADPSANTEIPVPQGKAYTTSGNNVDGFIVTVEG